MKKTMMFCFFCLTAFAGTPEARNFYVTNDRELWTAMTSLDYGSSNIISIGAGSIKTDAYSVYNRDLTIKSANSSMVTLDMGGHSILTHSGRTMTFDKSKIEFENIKIYNGAGASRTAALVIENSTASFKDIVFEKNLNTSSYIDYLDHNGGALNISGSTATFSGKAVFTGNYAKRGGAVYLNNSVINFNDGAVFKNNSSYSGYGSAIIMQGSSTAKAEINITQRNADSPTVFYGNNKAGKGFDMNSEGISMYGYSSFNFNILEGSVEMYDHMRATGSGNSISVSGPGAFNLYGKISGTANLEINGGNFNLKKTGSFDAGRLFVSPSGTLNLADSLKRTSTADNIDLQGKTVLEVSSGQNDILRARQSASVAGELELKIHGTFSNEIIEIITSTNGVTGSFGSVSAPDSLTVTQDTSDSTKIQLLVNGAAKANIFSGSMAHNQKEIAVLLDNLSLTSTGRLDEAISLLDSMELSEKKDTLNGMSGSFIANVIRSGASYERYSRYGSYFPNDSEEKGAKFWMDITGGQRTYGKDENSGNDFTDLSYGALLGYDIIKTNDRFLGFGIKGVWHDFKQGDNKGHSMNYGLDLYYGMKRKLDFFAAVGYENQNYHLDRYISLFDSESKSDFNANLIAFSAESGINVYERKNFALRPFLGFEADALFYTSFTEKGTPALDFDIRNDVFVKSDLKAGINLAGLLEKAFAVKWDFSAVFRQTLTGNKGIITASFEDIYETMEFYGAESGKSRAEFEGNARVPLSINTDIRLSARYAAGKDVSEYAFTLGFTNRLEGSRLSKGAKKEKTPEVKKEKVKGIKPEDIGKKAVIETKEYPFDQQKYNDDESNLDIYLKQIPANAETGILSGLSKEAYDGNENAVASLIAGGADVNAADGAGRTALMYAASANEDGKMINMLVKAGADVEAKDSFGADAMCYAAANNGSLEVIKTLYKKGLSVDEKDSAGKSAFDYASMANPNPNVIQFMIQKSIYKNNLSAYYLEAAANNPNLQVLAVFRDYGVSQQAVSDGARELLIKAVKEDYPVEAFKEILASDADINAFDGQGLTVLMRAAASAKNPEIIETLLDAGAEADLKNDDGVTALMCSAGYNGDSRITKILIDAGGRVDETDNTGRTALMYAASRNNVETLLTLLENGAEVQVTDKSGNDSMTLALINNPDIKILEELEKSGLSLKKQIRDKEDIILYVAGGNTNPEILKMLIKLGAKTDVKDEHGKTPLIYAASYNTNEQITKILIGAGAKINDADNRNLSAIKYAAMENPDPAVIETLIKAGADLGGRASDGCYEIVHLAIFNPNANEIVPMLEKATAERTEKKEEKKPAAAEENSVRDYIKNLYKDFKKPASVKLLDSKNINYAVEEYAAGKDTEFFEDKNNAFVSMLLKGDKTGYFIVMIPRRSAVNFNLVKQATGNGQVEVVERKESAKISGYEPEVLTPLAAKKDLPVFMDASAEEFPLIYISAGTRGIQIKISPKDLAEAVKADIKKLK